MSLYKELIDSFIENEQLTDENISNLISSSKELLLIELVKLLSNTANRIHGKIDKDPKLRYVDDNTIDAVNYRLKIGIIHKTHKWIKDILRTKDLPDSEITDLKKCRNLFIKDVLIKNKVTLYNNNQLNYTKLLNI